MDEQAPEDRRAFSRILISATASLELPDGSTAVGQVGDLSMGGVALACAVQPDVDTEGRLAIVFGSGGSAVVIRGQARVVRANGLWLALEILELDLDSYHHLQNLILYNSDLPDRSQSEIDGHLGLKRR